MEYVREIPSECLCAGEAAGVWSGWSSHGDREVVREAAAKGTHVELAHKCLAYRRRCSVAEAKKYFAEELEIWIDEMLAKRQIHRASHILSNARKNPLEFIRDRCVECREPKLRRYLADYVLSKKGFEAKHEEAWNVMKSVALLEEKNGSEESLMGDWSIEEICQLPDDVRSALVADLHFNAGASSCFTEKLNASVLWDYLLANNKVDLIVCWIDAYYRESAEVADAEEAEEEISLTSTIFRRLAIDEEMIERVAHSGATSAVKELVLDRLSGYGILTREESQDVRSVLGRFFSNRLKPEVFGSLLASSSSRCTVEPTELARKIFSVIYQRDASTESCSRAPETGSLLELMRKLIPRPEVASLKRAIVNNVRILDASLEAHFLDDPILLLTLLLLEHKTGSERRIASDFRDIVKNDLYLEPEVISRATIRESLKKIPYLASWLEDAPRSNATTTMYDLLVGYEGLDVARSFEWRDRRDNELPNFRDENLAKKYGREEKLSYVHYLRESRPSMAVRALERESLEVKVKTRRDACENVKVNEDVELETEVTGSDETKVSDEVCEVKVSDKVDEVKVSDKVDGVRVNDKVDEVRVNDKVDEVNANDKVDDKIDEVKVNEVIETEVTGSGESKVNDEVNEVKANNEVKVGDDGKAEDEVKVTDQTHEVKVNAEADEVKVNAEADEVKVKDEADEVSEAKNREKHVEVKAKPAEPKVNISDEVKVSEEIDDLEVSDEVSVIEDIPKVNSSDDIKIKDVARRVKIIGDLDEVDKAKKTTRVRLKVKNKARPEVGSDAKMETKIEAAAYARGLALDLGEDEVTCACVAFVELLGLNSDCLRVDATALAYVENSLGVSMRDAPRSLGSSSSPRNVATLLHLLERSFEVNHARDRIEELSAARDEIDLDDDGKVDLKVSDKVDPKLGDKVNRLRTIKDFSKVSLKDTSKLDLELGDLKESNKVDLKVSEKVDLSADDKVDLKVVDKIVDKVDLKAGNKVDLEVVDKVDLKVAKSFVESVKTWDTIVRFARTHETSLPRSFLRLLAHEDRRLEFVLVGQLFAYPLEALLTSARDFANSRVREHLSLAMRNERLLVTTTSTTPPTTTTTTTTTTRCDLEARNFRETEMTSDEESNDLWTLILRCHGSQDPPGAFLEASKVSRSPILNVLAACYEPSAASVFCYTWLVVSIGTVKLLREYDIPVREELWSARLVRRLLRSAIDLGFVVTISRAFEIFIPSHPLARLFHAYRDFPADDVHEESTFLKRLRSFVESCKCLASNPVIEWDNPGNDDYLWNSRWIVHVAVESSMNFLASSSSSPSLYLSRRFLELHARANFNEELHVGSPNFSVLKNIVDILGDTGVKFDFRAIELDDRGSNVERETQRCVEQLLVHEDFENAIALSKVAGLGCSNIILAKYRSEFKRSDENDGKLEPTFWKRCAEDLKKYEVSFDETAAFFIEYAEKVLSHRERYEILKLALESLRPIVTDKKTLDTVEMAMWKSCVLAGPDTIELEKDCGIFDKLKAELLSGIADLRVSCTLNDATEEHAVKSLIGRYVVAGQLSTALRISAIFNCKLRDLQILMLCLSLAEGEISPYQLTSQQRSLLSETGRMKYQKYSTLRNRGLHRASPASAVSTSSPSLNEETSHFIIQQIQLDSLTMIDRLTKSLESGTGIGTRILLCAKLAIYLRRSYQSLLCHDDPMKLLYEVVGSNCERKLEIVGDIVAAYRVKSENVAKFLAEEIVANTPRLVEESLEDSLVMWGNPLGNNIQAIIDLCNDPSLLGWELLRTANLSLGNSHGERRNVLTLKVAIELLIRSHDCFTASCSMEGIASILRKAQHLAYTLQHRKHWSLLVRLVTGLGRFTEMNYVFQILKENDQFEFLLGKGLDKIPGLKTALLEFCKRQCPGDKELFTLIALHFTLYNEIAYNWESEARELMNEIVAEARKNSSRNASGNFITLRITRNESVEKKLQVVVENFTHATEYYLQDNKLNLASRCSHQAQLAALQISLVSGVGQNHQAICLFNLGPEELNRAICQELTVPQALVLLQAYNCHGDWSSAIYSHVVASGETRYLKEFLSRRSLTAAIVQDCVCRYRSEKTYTRQMTEHMELIVNELSDVECKYVLASQLGFKRIVEEMLGNTSTGSYLKDTVWKQGFKSTDFYE